MAASSRLLQLWMETTTAARLSASATQRWWERIVELYTEPQRHYHTLEHLEELNAYLDIVRPCLYDVPTVAWTLFFHDIIYDPKRGDNEEKSADLWLDFCREMRLECDWHEPQVVTTVRNYILQTKHHMACPDDADKDLLYFLDMDVAILGASHERYVRYADQIAREYGHYPRDAYCSGRKRILEVFLQAPRLFRTPEIASRCAEAARANLQYEIVLLTTPPYSAAPLTFADRSEVLAFENECRSDALRLTQAQLNHILSMNTGAGAVAFRHRETKGLLGIVIASTTYNAEELKSRLAAQSALPEDERVAHRVLASWCANGPGYDVEARSESEVHGDHMLIHSVAVKPDCRRKGVATLLMKHWLEGVRREMPQVTRITAVVPIKFEGAAARLGFTAVRPHNAFARGSVSSGMRPSASGEALATALDATLPAPHDGGHTSGVAPPELAGAEHGEPGGSPVDAHAPSGRLSPSSPTMRQMMEMSLFIVRDDVAATKAAGSDEEDD